MELSVLTLRSFSWVLVICLGSVAAYMWLESASRFPVPFHLPFCYPVSSSWQFPSLVLPCITLSHQQSLTLLFMLFQIIDEYWIAHVPARKPAELHRDLLPPTARMESLLLPLPIFSQMFIPVRTFLGRNC